jgi:hypothetical protein
VFKKVIQFIRKLMTRTEKQLLKDITRSNWDAQGDLLSNVKAGMGELRALEGNPFFKAEISLQVELFFTENNLEILPAALPPVLQTQFPVFLFGLTDWYAGYVNGRRIVQVIPPWALAPMSTGVFTYNGFVPGPLAILLAHGIQEGDIFFQYFANVGGLIYLANIIIHCTNLAYGTFLNSFVSDLIIVNGFRYFLPIVIGAGGLPVINNQFDNNLIFGYQTLFGKLRTDNIDPKMYNLSTDFQNNIVDIPAKFPLDKNMQMGFYQNFDCLNVSFLLFVSKVEPLTLYKQIKSGTR